jgi:hypothetical protein
MSAFYWNYKVYQTQPGHSIEDVYNNLINNSGSIFATTTSSGSQFQSEGTPGTTYETLHAFVSQFRVAVMCPPAFGQSTNGWATFYMIVAVSGDGDSSDAQALHTEVVTNIHTLADNGTIFQLV